MSLILPPIVGWEKLSFVFLLCVAIFMASKDSRLRWSKKTKLRKVFSPNGALHSEVVKTTAFRSFCAKSQAFSEGMFVPYTPHACGVLLDSSLTTQRTHTLLATFLPCAVLHFLFCLCGGLAKTHCNLLQIPCRCLRIPFTHDLTQM